MATALRKIYQRIRFGKPIVVVSGLPRSGTSMAMKMLDAAGLDCVSDGVRTADEDNPKGYFEDERVKDLGQAEDTRWLRNARGRVVKIVSPLLQHLPDDNLYRVVFMRRDLREVLASQKKMLDNRDEASDTADEEMLAGYEQHLEKIEFLIRYRPYFEAVFVDYRNAIENPLEEAHRIAAFLGGDLDPNQMAGVVDNSLYRNRG